MSALHLAPATESVQQLWIAIGILFLLLIVNMAVLSTHRKSINRAQNSIVPLKSKLSEIENTIGEIKLLISKLRGDTMERFIESDKSINKLVVIVENLEATISEILITKDRKGKTSRDDYGEQIDDKDLNSLIRAHDATRQGQPYSSVSDVIEELIRSRVVISKNQALELIDKLNRRYPQVIRMGRTREMNGNQLTIFKERL